MNLLMQKYGERVLNIHMAEAPGAARDENSPLLESSPLSGQMPLLESRDRTYLCLLVNLARIFKRWTRRDHLNDADNFRRGLAHILILSCAGSGGPLRGLSSFHHSVHFLADSCAYAWQACSHLPNRAGKTTVLEMLLHWLRSYLREHKEQSLLHFFCGAMYPDRDPRALLREEKEGEEKRVVEDFLEAL